jgi:hypothetical protein
LGASRPFLERSHSFFRVQGWQDKYDIIMRGSREQQKAQAVPTTHHHHHPTGRRRATRPKGINWLKRCNTFSVPIFLEMVLRAAPVVVI